MRVCRRIIDGRIIEAQSGGNEGDFSALLANAISAGYSEDEIEFIIMSDAEVSAAIRSQNEQEIEPAVSPLQLLINEIAKNPDADPAIKALATP